MTISDLKSSRHLSHSQVSTYLLCPLRYKLSYVERVEPDFVSSALVQGSGIHEVIASFYQAHLQNERLPREEMVRQFHSFWEAEEQKKPIKFNGDDREATIAMSERLIEVFCEKVQPKQIIAIEEPFRISIGEELPDLVGVIDLIESDETGEITVADTKTAAKRYSDFDVAENNQLTVYSLACKSMGFEQEPLLRLDILLKQKNCDLVKMHTLRNDAQRARVIRLIKAVWDAISKEAFYPNRSFMCPSCQYSRICQDW